MPERIPAAPDDDPTAAAPPVASPLPAVPPSPPQPASCGPIALDLPAGVHHLCGCGRSRHGWFCDGAHLGTGRVSFELRLDQAGTVLLCGCGRSGRHPLCDGHHASPRRTPWWRRLGGG